MTMNRRSPIWFLRMAWRDSRGSRTHLLLGVMAVALSIGALVAVRSFGDQMDRAIRLQTRSLLGADLSVRSLQPFSPQAELFLAKLPGAQVRETRVFSMVSFPRAASARLCQIRGLSGPFPFYGDFVTDPPEAASLFLHDTHLAVMEENLMIQFGAEPGDTIRIGTRDFIIAGSLRKVSGEVPATSAFIGPRVYIAMHALSDTDLLREGSLARYYAHYQLPSGVDGADLPRHHRSELAALRLEMETAEQRQSMMGASLENLYRYLNLGGLIALLLGGIGLAAAIQLYARKKRATVAVLRCLGADARTAFSIYVAQAAAVAILGAILGIAIGMTLQPALPGLLKDFLPVEVGSGWAWSPIALSLLYGAALAVCFALVPLVSLRRIPPLTALRPETTDRVRRRFDPLQGLILFAPGIGLIGFAVAHTDRWTQGLALAAALGGVFILLAGLARGLMGLARRILREGWPFAWRQGIANIHRPYNQTSVLLLALGLGAFLLAALSFTQHNLTRQFRRTDQEGQPNMILFDIQRDQVAAVESLIAEQQLDRFETTPIVTMRLSEVNGRRVSALRDDPDLDIPHWILFREYRCTYQQDLAAHETLLEGEWRGRVTDPTQPIPVSVDKVMADHLQIGLGARLTFDLQGVRLQTEVRSIRKVDWRQMRTNFFVIFPAGVLEEAPQQFAAVIRAPSPADSAQLQNRVVSQFPNVSAVDLRMIVQSMNDILDKAADVVRVMALFSMLVGLLVLGGTVVTSRYDRKEESDLLRTLGATRGQLTRIMAAEYVILGGTASVAGVLMALLASWSAAHWLFDLPFSPALWPLIVVPLSISCATLLVGLAATGTSACNPK